MCARKADTPKQEPQSPADKIARSLLSDADLAALESAAAAETNTIKKTWKQVLVKRQYNLRATMERLNKSRTDGFDREVADLDEKGFEGAGGGRMSTVMPPVEYRGTTVQVAGMYPWIVGAKAPLLGTALGRHLRTGAAVGFDPLYAWKMKAISAPSCFICALNAFGKSTLLRRICLGDIGRGTHVIAPGDVKPDLRALAEAVGGQVSEVGYGTGSINPLDRGPIGEAIEQLTEGSLERQRAEFALHARQLNMVCALLEIVRRGPLKDFEETMLASAIRLIYSHPDSIYSTANPARMEDLIEIISDAPEELREDAVADDAAEYRAQIKPLLRSMRALVKGRFGETFNQHSTVRIDITKPMIDLDMSSVPPGDELMRAAVLLAGWNEAFAAVEAAHILADVGLGPNRAFHIVMDEFWQVLACGPMMVARVDAVQRLQRAIGVAMTTVTHSIAELEKAGGLGLIERSRARIIGPVPEAEVDRLSKFMKFSEAERAMLTGWANDGTSAVDEKKAIRKARRKAAVNIAATSIDSARDASQETKRTAAGVGHFLLKLGEGAAPGTPFKVWVPPIEHASGIHDTDARLRSADEDRGKEFAA